MPEGLIDTLKFTWKFIKHFESSFQFKSNTEATSVDIGFVNTEIGFKQEKGRNIFNSGHGKRSRATSGL